VSIAEEDTAGRPSSVAAAVQQGDPEGRTTTLVIAAAVCATAMSFNVWYPFLPLYALDLGAASDANAVFWVAIAITVQGIARLASSAVWGFMSDRYGRKLMLLRAMYLSSITFAVAALATEPWHLSIALGCQGFFSGFIPASVALVSVSVPDSRLNRSLSMVTGAQYLGTTTGPALGAGLALAFGYRGSIAVAAVVPLLAATLVLLRVPRDEVGARGQTRLEGPRPQLEPFRLSGQFILAVMTLLGLYCMLELVRLATPIALRALEEGGDVAGVAGVTFSLGGLASAVSVLALAPMFFNRGSMRTSMALFCGLGALGCALLAASSSVPVYVVGYLLIAVVISSMVPAGNTLIAANVVRSRRGTGFGVAASVQALSFAIGPLAASFFAAVSLDLGFLVVTGLFLALGLVLLAALREPPAG
jgi:MFS transporter, DHA1 family, multidrug resistance protein